MVFHVNSPKLIFRASLLAIVSILMLIDHTMLSQLLSIQLGPLKISDLFFLFLAGEMLIVLVPVANKRIGCGKHLSRHFRNAIGFSRDALTKTTANMRRQVLIVLIIWLLICSNIGLLYKFKVLKREGLYLISLVFYFLDQFFISVWCPYQALIMKNKCCNTCRIYNWGHFMMFSPLVFIRSAYPQALFWMSVVILLIWERQYYRHPERFSEISNLNLRCTECSSVCTKKI